MIERRRRDRVTSRLRSRAFNYGTAATYFVTICTAGRVSRFGDVTDGAMVLSDVGVMIDSWWGSIPRRFPDVSLDASIVMPDHIHGVLATGTALHLPVSPLPEVIRWYKSQTTRDYGVGVRISGWPAYKRRFWQDGYYDHIVRSDADLERIRAYIESNPERWADRIEH